MLEPQNFDPEAEDAFGIFIPPNVAEIAAGFRQETLESTVGVGVGVVEEDA